MMTTPNERNNSILTAFTQGMLESYAQWLEQHQHKKISFWGFGEQTIETCTESSITRWGYTFTKDDFNKPLPFKQRLVAYWFNIDIYFNYVELKATKEALEKSLINQNAQANIIEDQSKENLEKVKLSWNQKRQFKKSLANVLSQAINASIKTVMKDRASEQIENKNNLADLLAGIIQAQEAAVAQAELFKFPLDIDSIPKFLGKNIGAEVLKAETHHRMNFLSRFVSFIVKFFHPAESQPESSTAEVDPSIPTENLVVEENSLQRIKAPEKPLELPESGFESGSDVSSEKDQSLDFELEKSDVAIMPVVTPLKNSSSAQINHSLSSMPAAATNFADEFKWGNLAHDPNETNERRVAIDHARIVTLCVGFERNLIHLEDQEQFNAKKQQYLNFLERTLKVKQIPMSHHPDKRREDENAHQAYLQLQGLLSERIEKITQLQFECRNESAKDMINLESIESRFALLYQQIEVFGEKIIGIINDVFDVHIEKLHQGFMQITDGITGVRTQFEEGLLKLAATEQQAYEAQEKHWDAIEGSCQGMNTGLRGISTGIKEISMGIKEISTGINEMSTGINEMSTGINEMSMGIKEIGADIKELGRAAEAGCAEIERACYATEICSERHAEKRRTQVQGLISLMQKSMDPDFESNPVTAAPKAIIFGTPGFPENTSPDNSQSDNLSTLVHK